MTGGIKITAAISVFSSAGPFYTCPANSYAILNVRFSAGAAATSDLRVGGQVIGLFTLAGAGQFPSYTPGAGVPITIYVGPGQSVTSNIIAGAGSFSLSGVQFTN